MSETLTLTTALVSAITALVACVVWLALYARSQAEGVKEAKDAVTKAIQAAHDACAKERDDTAKIHAGERERWQKEAREREDAVTSVLKENAVAMVSLKDVLDDIRPPKSRR